MGLRPPLLMDPKPLLLMGPRPLFLMGPKPLLLMDPRPILLMGLKPLLLMGHKPLLLEAIHTRSYFIRSFVSDKPWNWNDLWLPHFPKEHFRYV